MLYIVRRLLQAVVVMLVVAFVSFLMFNHLGDPVHNMVGQESSAEERAQIREKLGLDEPFYIQFGAFLNNVVQGDFGTSYRTRERVWDIIQNRLPATLELAFVSAAFALVFGIIAGVFTAIYRGTVLSELILTFSLIGVSVPTFLLGILLIYIFGVWVQNYGFSGLPTFGQGELVSLGWWRTSFLTSSGLQALILPAVTLGLYQLTVVSRLMRAEMLEILRTDYIKFARARGLPERIVTYGHAMRNSLIPVVTISGLQLGLVIAFAIITETVFQWPGVGLMFIQAVEFVDIPIMAAYLLLVALIFVIINLVVDLLYFLIDPRLRTPDNQ